jgi:conjugative transfer pilus assembly protein TraH
MGGVMIAAVAGSLFAGGGTARADLSGALGEMLGEYVQVNAGGAITTMQRGGFYGGSVYVRSQVVDVSVLNFTPPSFASSCGAIDMFGGSFSMINAEQFVQLLRSVAQNAAGYAFQLALKNICEQCATLVAGLQKAVQEMNQFTGNSCQLAQGIVNDSLSAFEMSDTKGMSSASVVQGWDDAWTGFWEGWNESVTALNTMLPDGTNIYEERYEVNVTWKAILNMDGDFNLPTDPEIREALMSLYGSVILRGPTDDRDGNTSRDVQRLAGTRLTVRDLVYGNDAASVYSCDSTDKCLTVSTVAEDVQGLLEHLEEAYIGTGPTDSTSLLFQLVNGTDTQKDDAREALILNLGSIGGMLIKIASVTPPGGNAPWILFDRHKEYIAVEMASLFLVQTTAAIEQELGQEQYDTAYAESWRTTDFKTAQDRLGRELSDLFASVEQPDTQQFTDMFRFLVTTNPFVD